MALFITFEGGEGSGKTFQARALYRKLLQMAIPALLTHEPGGTEIGDKITRLLKWGKETDITPLTELLLFNASRAQLIKEVIQPNLEEGKVVICDRYTDSTICYQSYGRGLDIELVRAINSTATLGIKPDLTVLMDVPVEEGFSRRPGRRQDRFEQEDIAFHQRIREGYLKLAGEDPVRWLVIDAAQPKTTIRKIIWKKVSSLLPEK
jgi:dTMP kinase